MKSLILNFFLLVLRIPLDFSLNADQKGSKFSKTFLDKSLGFVSSKEDGIITFNMDFVLLSAEVDPILKEKSNKKDALRVCGAGYIEMVFALSTEVIALHIGATIIQVEISGFKNPISRYKVRFAIFLAFYKQF